jgi:hypothetical protein
MYLMEVARLSAAPPVLHRPPYVCVCLCRQMPPHSKHCFTTLKSYVETRVSSFPLSLSALHVTVFPRTRKEGREGEVSCNGTYSGGQQQAMPPLPPKKKRESDVLAKGEEGGKVE